jgi:hypothetical protein
MIVGAVHHSGGNLMSAEDVMYRISEEAGLDLGSQLSLALEYINNQKCDEVFEEFLLHRMAEEAASGDWDEHEEGPETI